MTQPKHEQWRWTGSCSEDKDFVDFPDKKTQSKEIEYSKSVCKQCPVRHECYTYALVNDIREGIWGGTFYEERSLINSIIGIHSSMPFDEIIIRLKEPIKVQLPTVELTVVKYMIPEVSLDGL